MTGAVKLLAQRTVALTETLESLAPAAPDVPPLDQLLQSADDATLMLVLRQVGDLLRSADALLARAAGEVEGRSGRDREDPLARRMGEKSAVALVASVTGIDVRRAGDASGVGVAVRPRRALLGDALEAERSTIGAALDDGALSLEAARLVASTLDHVERHESLERVDECERMLVKHATELPVSDLSKVCRHVRDHVDPDGAEPREEVLRAQVRFKKTQQRDGMTRWLIEADPESAGFITAALDARTSPKRRLRFVDELEEPVDLDTRTMDRILLDGLVSIARDSLKADEGDLSGTAVTMLVTVPLDALKSGIGTAEIAGVHEPISARTARRLACEAHLIPVVLGGESQPLDFGAARRLFSTAQRHAMAVRDGGCVWPGCDAPPGRCEAAHVVPWSLDPMTDLSNGLLLCRFHHRRYDNDGWEFRFRDGAPYLVPPPWVDASQTPRRAGRAAVA
ncbi:HNH endonuclease signature motif containing protein [Herbiconiux sp. SYSU D00978]|uniref:HNH endonuclease signature motif containing protein n=1 Tax=Herbiconiux sp. SYSU D00978 TaxID=2812562 RepID=UPI001A96B9FF|nr:HNH endonuclease signature motif containing protein [Herbiconiux sp. SYSU D00978]